MPTKCSVCGRSDFGDLTERWNLSSGEALLVPSSAILSIEDPRSDSDEVLCERCYAEKRFPFYRDDELYEMHMEFGHVYYQAKKYQDAANAFQRAIEVRCTAHSLAHLALCRNMQGDKKGAIILYQLALDLDPDHFISKRNLANLLE